MKTFTLLYISSLLWIKYTNAQVDSNDSNSTTGEAVNTTSGITHSNDASCRPKQFLGGKVSTCNTYQITTLNASPRRCIHIESILPTVHDDDSPTICLDFQGWFDGTNGCDAYTKNSHFCPTYGHLEYPSSEYKPNQACCACGGGKTSKPRLRIGDYVTLKGYRQLDQCKSLKIVKIESSPSFRYVLEVMAPCGQRVISRQSNGSIQAKEQFQKGQRISLGTDDPSVINKSYRVQLRKCRKGVKEQEFEFYSTTSDDSALSLQHKISQVPLAVALGAVNPIVNMTQIWSDDLFENSGDFFYLKILLQGNAGMPNADGSYSYLTSGNFGEKEYSEVHLRPVHKSDDAQEQEFSMWAFKQIIIDESDQTTDAVDEHVEWLEKKTEMIGIDYLEELAPWDLLDVERDATKSEVKSRFRELSRRFHPDKLLNQPEKLALFERIFILLQSAYEGLKSTDEREKEKFRVRAESDSQLFTHSQHIVELLPIYWMKIDSKDDIKRDKKGVEVDRYILNVASHLNHTYSDTNALETETESAVQLWVIFMYSARCSMSRTVRGMVDLAAAHLKKHYNMKVGAYGCGLYKNFEASANDPLGISSDPICKQFQRRETPNVHVIVETLPIENGIGLNSWSDMATVIENAKFKHFYASVPDGNTTQFFPDSFIAFAKAGKRIWDNRHLVKKMTQKDFLVSGFVRNYSAIAFLDGTGHGNTDHEVVDAINSALPGVARRFLKEGLFVGTALCGNEDEVTRKGDDKYVDCAKLGVAWLPEIKVYGQNDTVGTSLLRGQFGDRRDVQIAIESMGNILRMIFGGDDKNEDDFEDVNNEEGDGSCSNQPPENPRFDENLDLPNSDKQGNFFQLNMEMNDFASSLEQSKISREPILSNEESNPKLANRRGSTGRDRISNFEARRSRRSGGGKIFGGNDSRGGGFIGG